MKYRSIFLFVFLFVAKSSLNAQSSNTQLDFLKQNIHVWMLSGFNSDTPQYRMVRTEGIYMDTDTIIFGRTSNNGLGQAALVLSALFKDPSKNKGGDQQLQDMIYGLMKPMNNPVELYIVNDIYEDFDMSYAPKYSFYLNKTENSTTIRDAVYKPEDPTSAGSIIISGRLMSQKEF